MDVIIINFYHIQPGNSCNYLFLIFWLVGLKINFKTSICFCAFILNIKLQPDVAANILRRFIQTGILRSWGNGSGETSVCVRRAVFEFREQLSWKAFTTIVSSDANSRCRGYKVNIAIERLCVLSLVPLAPPTWGKSSVLTTYKGNKLTGY